MGQTLYSYKLPSTGGGGGGGGYNAQHLYMCMSYMKLYVKLLPLPLSSADTPSRGGGGGEGHPPSNYSCAYVYECIPISVMVHCCIQVCSKRSQNCTWRALVHLHITSSIKLYRSSWQPCMYHHCLLVRGPSL